jgi:mRNA-degrading endonuclease toxin of MazEF toxin-antitoxin module
MEYKKDYDGSNNLIKQLESREPPYFKEREVWWAIIGMNVGHEEDGKGKYFLRPVLIFKKFGRNTFIGIPLSTTEKSGGAYVQIKHNNKTSTALLGQIRTFDSRRLTQRYGIIDNVTFEIIRKTLKDLL